jgi:hypothetical protein
MELVRNILDESAQNLNMTTYAIKDENERRNPGYISIYFKKRFHLHFIH